MDKTNYSVARVETYTRASIVKAERHNERKNESYSNMNVDLIQTPNNVHYKKCKKTYNEKLKEMIDDGEISLRGLKDNAKVFDEIIFDINSDYFEQNGGYEFAKCFYEKAFHFAEREMSADNIISAIMHADELNTALSEEYGKPIYHYHLHVIAIPVVQKEIKYSKRCKDKSLIGTTKEIINQVSHSKKWKSEHLTDLEFKIKKETEKLEKITNSVNEKQSNFDNYMQYDKQIDDISNLGKQKKFSKKIELEPNDYETLTQYAKKGIVADKEIYERDTRIENLRNTLNKWIEKYDGLVEKTKDYFHAVKLAPQRVADFFKWLFDKEKQDELERQRIEQEKMEAERKACEETREKEILERQKLKNSPEYRKRRANYER